MNSSLTISLQDGLLDLVQVLGEPGTIIPSAVRQYVVDRCLQRLDAAEAKIAIYMHKYGLDYETFNRRVTMDQDYLDRLNQNHPRWEADAIEWATRAEEAELWRMRLTQALQTSSLLPAHA